VLETLEWNELYLDSGAVAERCAALQSATNGIVVSYRRRAPAAAPGRRHLCSLLPPAMLTPSQIQLIQTAEREFADVFFVCYVAPDAEGYLWCPLSRAGVPQSKTSTEVVPLVAALPY